MILTEEQQEEFTEHFYSLEGAPNDCNSDNPNPWGCPWIWDKDYELIGDTITEMAERFYNENAKEIAELNYQEKGL